MSLFRRRLAFGALLLLLAQVSALAAPLAACSGAWEMAHQDRADCCPAGSHPEGQCPLHQRAASDPNACRLTCAAQTSHAFIPGLTGVLPPAVRIATLFTVAAAVRPTDPRPVSRIITPRTPPPESLL